MQSSTVYSISTFCALWDKVTCFQPMSCWNFVRQIIICEVNGFRYYLSKFPFFCFNSSAIHTQFLKRIIYSWSFTIIRKLVEHWPSLLMACVRSNVLSYIYIFLRLFIVHDSLWKQNKTKQEGYHLSNNVVAFFVDHYISTA